MKIVKKTATEKAEATKTIYGHKISSSASAVSAFSRFNDELHLEKFNNHVKIELTKINHPKRIDAIKYTYIKNNVSSFEIKPLLTIRDDEEYENDSRLLESFENLKHLCQVKKIYIRDMLDIICGRFKDNVRYAYKNITHLLDKNRQYCVYIFHIIVLFIANISILNDVDFMPPIRIKVVSSEGGFRVTFTEKTRRANKIYKKRDKELLVKIEAKLAYLAALCREDSVNSKIVIDKSGISLEYYLPAIEISRGAVYSRADMEEKIFNEYIELFNYTKREEEEEELIP